MSDNQQGDVSLFQIDDNGEICIDAGIVKMDGGLQTAAYLSLYGGNTFDSAQNENSLEWWGNGLENEEAKKYRSRFQFQQSRLPITSGNRIKFEDAAREDLQWLLDEKIASEITVSVTIPKLNRLAVSIIINAFGELSVFEFTENWQEGVIKCDADLTPFVEVVSVIYSADAEEIHVDPAILSFPFPAAVKKGGKCFCQKVGGGASRHFIDTFSIQGQFGECTCSNACVWIFFGEWDCAGGTGSVTTHQLVGCVDPSDFTFDEWIFIEQTGPPDKCKFEYFINNGLCTGGGDCTSEPSPPAAPTIGICSC